MIAITTSNSISVNPRRARRGRDSKQRVICKPPKHVMNNFTDYRGYSITNRLGSPQDAKMNVSMDIKNSFGSVSSLRVRDREYQICRLETLEKKGVGSLARIPYSIRILLENMLRFEDDRIVKHTDIEYVAKWDKSRKAREINFRPARVLL